jgi:hypothetical protein
LSPLFTHYLSCAFFALSYRKCLHCLSVAGGAGVVRGELGATHRMWKEREHTHFLAICELIEADGAYIGRDYGHPVRAIDLDGDAPEHALLDPSRPAEISDKTILTHRRTACLSDEAARE